MIAPGLWRCSAAEQLVEKACLAAAWKRRDAQLSGCWPLPMSIQFHPSCHAVSAGAIITAAIASQYPERCWWSDPVGGILISLYIAARWAVITRRQAGSHGVGREAGGAGPGLLRCKAQGQPCRGSQRPGPPGSVCNLTPCLLPAPPSPALPLPCHPPASQWCCRWTRWWVFLLPVSLWRWCESWRRCTTPSARCAVCGQVGVRCGAVGWGSLGGHLAPCLSLTWQ